MLGDLQYLTAQRLEELKEKFIELKDKTIPEIAKRIDEAKQQGDLSENAEYHQAREDMSWAKGRLLEIEQIVNNAQIIKNDSESKSVRLGSKVTFLVNGQKKIYTIVGPQEANPALGIISNESPLGRSFIDKDVGDKIEVVIPAGKQVYEILEIK